MTGWTLNPEYATGVSGELFADLDSVFALEGEQITSDDISTVHKVWVADRFYYVKRYTGAGKNLRRYMGRPRIQAEWENLQHFQAWGIPSAIIVGFGMERRSGAFYRGALVTQELSGTADLAQIARNDDPRFRNPVWVNHVSRQVAHATRMMHDQRFAHNDLKWRNILVDEKPYPDVFMIDCPSGSFWWGPLLEYRIIKDLACLDKLGKQVLSRSQRLRFYHDYCENSRLTAVDKKRIRAIVHFFRGRE
ncbi:lipopolysaccharide kinase InaA family protein [Halopseudomonas sp.]|uniref:lipopolysaccharide kinase InaA family protein n=1 Tax=Halopseudomonas sp. TaxID=2901191 RepID=UPI003561B61A